jgi:hypothetical protein
MNGYGKLGRMTDRNPDNPRHARVGNRQQPGRSLDECDLAAEPGKRLCQLAADRAATQHREAPRQLARPEDGLVGQVIRLRQRSVAKPTGESHGLPGHASGLSARMLATRAW